MTHVSYVRDDEHGVKRIGESRVMLDSIVAAYQSGHSAETIAQQYPSLSLEQVYGAIAYYLANIAAVDEYLRRQADVWDRERKLAEASASPVVARLRSQTSTAESRVP